MKVVVGLSLVVAIIFFTFLENSMAQCFTRIVPPVFDLEYCYNEGGTVDFYTGGRLITTSSYSKADVEIRGTLYDGPAGSFLVIDGKPFPVSTVPWDMKE